MIFRRKDRKEPDPLDAEIARIWKERDRQAREAKREARRTRYCTKHMIRGRHLVNVYGGGHRTPGNRCDGPEHIQAPFL